MEPISRRTVLILGGVGATSLIVGGVGLAWTSSLTENSLPGPTFTEPTALSSVDGQLHVSLTAAPTTLEITGVDVAAVGYNGSVPGPTLRVRPGDRVTVSFTNNLDAVTNLHTHGLHVSPEGNSDNVFVAIRPGETFDYEYHLPHDHPTGVFWYHPHHHGLAADQTFGGLYGAILVAESTPPEVSRERVLVVSDISVDGSNTVMTASPMDRLMGREGEIVLVNGAVNPHIAASPGERERWRIVNACTSRFLRLRLDGQQIDLLGMDSGRIDPERVSEFTLAPGNRADVLVTMVAGSASLVAVPVDRGSMGMMNGIPLSQESGIATLTVDGAVSTRAWSAAPGAQLRDLRRISSNRSRVIRLEMPGGGMGGMGMRVAIDGRRFDAARVDTEASAGDIEEWTLTNTSPMDHPFHLHVWPMQVLSVGGVATSEVRYLDVVNVPANSSTIVRVAFDDFVGTTVYHCHILDHEDLGMMATIRVA